MNVEKLLWPISGCKVDQSVPIGMKLELDVWHYLLSVYTMFQIDISKHAEKSPENFAKSKTRKNDHQNSENMILAKNRTCVKKHAAGHLRTKFEEFTLINKATIAKIEFDLLLAVNYIKVTQLWWNSNSTCHLLNAYTKFEIDISKHVDRKSCKLGRTDGHRHGIIHPVFRVYKWVCVELEKQRVVHRLLLCWWNLRWCLGRWRSPKPGASAGNSVNIARDKQVAEDMWSGISNRALER